MRVENCSEGSPVESKRDTVYSFYEITRQEGVYIRCHIDGTVIENSARFITIKADNETVTLWYNRVGKQLQPALKSLYAGNYFRKVDATVRFEIEE